MKQLSNITTFVFMLGLFLLPSSEAQAGSCEFIDGELDDRPVSDGGPGPITTDEDTWCTVTPDYASFPLFKLGLCSEIPTYESYQTDCTFIVNNVAAQDLEIFKGSSLKVTDDISLLPGSYPAAVILLGNEISLKHSVSFAEEDYYGWASGARTEGASCSTTTSEGSQDYIGPSFGGFFHCSDEELIPGWFTETSGAYLAVDEDDSDAPAICSIVSGAIVAASSELAFSTASGSSVVCGMADASTLEAYDDYDSDADTDDTTNATRQLVVQTFTDPVVISNSSTSIDFGMKLDDMLSLEAYTGPDNVAYLNGFIDGIEFKVTVN